MENINVNFCVLSKADCLRSVSQFFDDGSLPFSRFQEYIAKQFNFDLTYLSSLDEKARISKIESSLSNYYDKVYPEMERAKNELEKEFKLIQNEVLSSLEEIFKVELSGDINAGVMFNATQPRYLDELAFEVYYNNDVSRQIETCIHEIIHFFYFEKWKQVFLDYKREEFECPHLVWLLSEISIDAVMKATKLNKFLYSDKPAYDYFYECEIEGKNMMDIFYNLFINNSIDNYFKKAIDFINQNRDYFIKLT